MTQEAAAAENADVSKDQVEKFFESGGESEQSAETDTSEEQEAKPEPKVEQADKPEKTVPYGALHEERMRRKELQQQVEQNTQKQQQMEEAFRKLVERSQEAEAPAFDTDPLNALRHQNEQLQQRLAYYDQRFQQSDEQQKQYEQHQRFVNEYQKQAAEFSSQTPEFNDAYKYLVNTRQSELESVGYSPQEAAQILVQEESMIVGKAMQDGVNPAERMFHLAMRRGWSKPEDSGKLAEGAKKLESIAKGQEASKTLSGGGKAKTDVSLEALAGLSDNEFDAAWEKLVGPNR